METKSCLKDSSADPSSQTSRKDRRVSFFEKAHVRPVPRKVSSSFREGIFTVPDLSSDRRGSSSGNTFGLTLDKYESSFSSQDSFDVPLDPRQRHDEDSFASPTVSDIESMHQSFADILASPSRYLKGAEKSFEAITKAKVSTLDDNDEEEQLSISVNDEENNNQSIEMDFTQCTGGIAGNVILSAYEAGVLDGLEKQADDMTMDITDCTGGIRSIVPQAIKDALLKSLTSERRKSLSAARPSMGGGEMDMTLCVGGIVAESPLAVSQSNSVNQTPEASFHSAKASAITPRTLEKREQSASPSNPIDSPSKKQKTNSQRRESSHRRSSSVHQIETQEKSSVDLSPRRSSRLSSTAIRESSPSVTGSKVSSRVSTPKKSLPIDGVILSPRVEALRRTGSSRKRNSGPRSSAATSPSSPATNAKLAIKKMPSPPPKMAPDSPTPMTGAKDLTMAMENAEQEEEFISNESFIGESYPPSEVNDNSLIMDEESPSCTPTPIAVSVKGLCNSVGIKFEDFSLPNFQLEPVAADTAAALEVEVYKKAIEELEFWVQKNQQYVDSIESGIQENLQTLLLAYGDNEKESIDRFKQMMSVANQMAESGACESWFEWIFSLFQPYAQAVFVRLQVLEKDVLLLQEIEKDIESAAAPILEQGQSIEAQLAEAKQRAAMFDPMEAVSLAEALDAIERIGMEIQEANQLSADIDAEFNNLEREYREMIDIQQELVEKKELVGKEALILENEVAHDDKSDTLLIQRKKNEYDLWTKIFFWNLEQVDVDKSLVLNYRNQLTIQYNPLLNQITILKESGLAKSFVAMLRETLRSPGFHSFADLKKFGFAVEIVLDFYRRVLEPLEKKARVNYSRQEQSGLTFQMQLPSGKQGIITMNGLSYFVNSPELNNVIN